MAGLPSWDQQSLASAFSMASLNQPPSNEWYFDSGATSHMTSLPHILSHACSSRYPTPSSIVVGNGSVIPVTATGSTELSPFLRLNNVLVSPQIIKNLISVRQFTTDNNCSVEFDPAGCSVKALPSRTEIVKCNRSGPLYPLRLPPASSFIAKATSPLWHRRLGHPGHEALSKLAASVSFQLEDCSQLCHACQLGRHTRLPFHASSSRATHQFDLIHCDLWTSPVASISGFKYYLVILDDCTHYLWTFSLRFKFDTFSAISNFLTYASTQFGASVKAIQCDNGKEFDNSTTCTFFLTRGIHFECLVPTPRLKTVKPNVLFAPLIMSFAPCYFRPPCLPATGSRPSPRRTHSLTFC